MFCFNRTVCSFECHICKCETNMLSDVYVLDNDMGTYVVYPWNENKHITMKLRTTLRSSHVRETGIKEISFCRQIVLQTTHEIL